MKRMIMLLVAILVSLSGCSDEAKTDSAVKNPAVTEATVSETPGTLLKKAEQEKNDIVKVQDGDIKKTNTEAKEISAISKDNSDDVDLDLTVLSSTMVFAEVYNIMYEPEKYIGKTIKMKGQFAYYKSEESENEYFSVFIEDAAACCAQGFEFLLKDKHTYPDDYPELGSMITVTGKFETYEDSGYLFARLIDSEIE